MIKKNNLNYYIKNLIFIKNYINFYTYMKICLYEKKLGYYSNKIINIGNKGDYTTFSEMGIIFTNCLSLNINKALNLLNGGYIIEIGAGTGMLAYKLLKECYKLKTKCKGYKIIEISEKLKKIQKKFLKKKNLQYKIEWISKLKKNVDITGIIICNEIIDAFPNYAFSIKNKKLSEKIITLNNFNYFQWSIIKIKKNLIKYINYINLKSNNYESEINLLIFPWIKKISSIINRGYIFIFDYGYTRKEYYNYIRKEGTIMCHYKHYAIKNIFINKGTQDITCHVDFTSIYESIKLNNMNYIKFEYLSKFFFKNKIKKLIKQYNKNNIKTNKEINKFMFPQEMGEVFKIICYGKNINKKI